MSIQKYLALLHTVDAGSISKAAQKLGYTQSAVSRMIADLEREWGVELLRRGRGGITVTSEGMQLLPRIRSVVSDCAELDYTVRELHGIHTGLVRVGAFTTVEDCWLPGLLKSFQNLYPQISFKLLHSESYGQVEEWIRRGQVDCGFVRLPCAPDLEARFLKRDQLAVVLPPDHPLADAEVYPAQRLKEEAIIRLETDREISRFLADIPVRYQVSSDHTIFSLVESGVGMCVMHALMEENCRYRVVWKPLDRTEYRDLGIATGKGTHLSGAAKLFVEHVCGMIG